MTPLLLTVATFLTSGAVASDVHQSFVQRPWIDRASRSFRDAAGRHMILHGVNVVYKVPPYIPSAGAFDSDTSLNEADISDLQTWGFNLVRLGIMWEAVEREPGVYDDVYLAKMDSLISSLGKRGIYTIVDAHQDVWSRATCGEGIPNFYAHEVLRRGATCFGSRFADTFLGPIFRLFGFCKSMESYGMRKDSHGNFAIEDCRKATAVFSDFYTSPEALTIARALYSNSDGLQDKFVAFWAHVSAALRHNPYVLGFDPLNEPFASWSDPLEAFKRMLPGNFDRSVLAPMYARIHAANLETDAHSISLFEPAIFPDDNPFGIQPLGFEAPPMDASHAAVNAHTYCCELDSQADSCTKNGEPSSKAEAGKECLKYHHSNVGQREADAHRLGVPLVISEFGACMDSDACAREIQQVADTCDEYLASWAYWQFKKFEDFTTTARNGSEGLYMDRGVQARKVKALARTFVRAAQGKLLSMHFNSTTGSFEAMVKVDTDIDAPTEVHALQRGNIGQVWYPAGFKITAAGPDGRMLSSKQVQIETHESTNRVLIKVSDTALSGQVMTVMLESLSPLFV